MVEKLVIALGGNALIREKGKDSIEHQFENAKIAMEPIVKLAQEGHQIVLTHGNGPQVGNILIRSEKSKGAAYDLSLNMCGAQSEGETGYILQQTLQKIIKKKKVDRKVTTVLSQVLVNKNDPAFKNPTKPVGPFYSEKDLPELKKKKWNIIEDSGRGYRRVVPSPKPLEIWELDIIQILWKHKVIVIACGGGGIPIIKGSKGAVGVDAVIDKDKASAMLAKDLKADKLIILTGVDQVCLNFNTPQEKKLENLTVEEAKKYLKEGHFGVGSMKPKIEAAIDYLENRGEKVIITSIEKLGLAMKGKAGTHITK